jgi:hypothetical protein
MPDVLSKDGFCFSALRDVGLYFVTLTQIEINDVIFLVFSRPCDSANLHAEAPPHVSKPPLWNASEWTPLRHLFSPISELAFSLNNC